MVRAATNVMVLTLTVFLGCSPGELKRSRVEELVSQQPAFSEPVTSLRILDQGLERGRYEAGEIEGMWTTSIGSDFYKRYKLTPLGQEHFARDFSIAQAAPLAKPARRVVVEVTGITTPPVGGESLRVGAFRWRYDGLTSVVSRYTGEAEVVHDGEALFQLFDDGWRLSKLELNESQGRVPFTWTAELEALLQKELEATRLSQEQALELATAAILSREPVMNFSLRPAWNLPVKHGLTGQPLNESSISAFLQVLKRHGVEALDVKPSGGYLRVAGLTPPDSWDKFGRTARATNVKTYALFKQSRVALSDFNSPGGESERASATVQITYSEFTPPWKLVVELYELPNFDYGGRPFEKVLWGDSAQWGRTQVVAGQEGLYADSATISFAKKRDGSWSASLR